MRRRNRARATRPHGDAAPRTQQRAGTARRATSRRALRSLTAAFVLGLSLACSPADPPLSISDVTFGAGDRARISIALAAGFVEGSFRATLDGVEVTAAFATGPGGKLGTLPLDASRAHRLEVTALVAGEAGVRRQTDTRSLRAPARLPALVASTPSPASTNVLRTAWLRLEFASAVTPEGRGTIALRCAGADGERAVRFGLHALAPSVLIVNPDGALPADSRCELSWRGPSGPERLAFATARAGEPAHVLHDRTDAGRTTPFPDDYWTRPDATLRTGLRLAMPVPARSADVQELFGSLLAQTHVLDGFSPLAPIVLEFDAAPDPASIPRTPAESLDPLATIGLFDLAPGSAEFGARVPFRADLRDDTAFGGRHSFSLLLHPSVPLEPGGRYGLVVTTRVAVDPTRPFAPSAFSAALGRTASPADPAAVRRARPLAEEVLDAVGTDAVLPIPRDDVALAIRFSVRTLDDLPDDLLAIREDVFEAPLPAVTLTSVTPEPVTSPVAAVVRGTFEAPDYRAGGLHFQRDRDDRPRQVRMRPVSFTLALPRNAPLTSAPVVLYQHGNPGSEEEVVTEAQGGLAAGGFAVIGCTDVLNREVSPPEIGDPFDRVSAQLANVLSALLAHGRIPDHWLQTHAEQIALVRALGAIARDPALRDLLPIGAPDGVVDLDLTAPLGFVGISEGANQAPGLLAYAPEIRAAALVGGGARLVEVLLHQQAEALVRAATAIFPGLAPVDALVALSLFQMLFDAQDGHNHARFLHQEPLPIASSSQRASVLLVEGIDDSLVPNHATESLAFALGPIPLLATAGRAVPYLERVAGPIEGNVDPDTTAALVQFVPDGVPGLAPTSGCRALDVAHRFEGHDCAQEAIEARRQRLGFLRSALDGTPRIVDPATQ